MNKNDVFPPTYFKAANLPEPITRKIVSATMEVMKNFHGQNERKLVIGFADEGRRLVMNRTNFDALAALHGPDTEQWLGKSVQLYADKIRVSGRSVDTVRVRAAV